MPKYPMRPPKQPLATTTPPKPEPIAAPVSNGAKPPRKQTLRQRAKKLAWRVTALYAWMWFGALVIFGSRAVESLQNNVANRFVQLLSSIGFAPVNGAALPFVFKAGWLLTITGFNPIQIVGLAIYVFSAPVWAFFKIVYHNALSQIEQSRPGLIEPRPNWSALPLFTGAVVGWFVLYGAASSQRELAVGVVLSGLLLILFTYRALQRTKPLTILEVSVLGKLEKWGASLPNSVTTREQKTPTVKRSEAAAHLATHRIFRDALLTLTLFIRGKRGKDRVHMFVLLEYVLFLFMLGIAGIFFWALVARTIIAPEPITFSTAFHLSASHFLPGVTAPSLPTPLPTWAQIGPSLTSWILFVLFVGPAASVVPVRQSAYGTRLTVTYSVLRNGTLFLSGYLRKLEKLKQSLPA